jgi:hypothetical protein
MRQREVEKRNEYGPFFRFADGDCEKNHLTTEKECDILYTSRRYV